MIDHLPRILIVDDDSELRQLLGMLIQDLMKVDIEEAGSGNEASEKINSGPAYDLIISDFNMPQGNGLDLFLFVEKMEKKPRFVLVTSDEKSDHSEITEVPGVGYLQKPFDETAIIEMLKESLNQVEPRPTTTDDQHAPISVQMARHYSPFPFELSLKIGPDHFVKFFNANHKIDQADLDRLKHKSIQELYVPRATFEAFLTQLQKSVFESLILTDQGLHHTFELTEVTQDLVKMGLKGLISDSMIMETATKNIKTVLAMMDRVEIFNDYLFWVDSKKMSPERTHTITLTLFCNLMITHRAQEADSKSNLNRDSLILSYAAAMHDFGLPEYLIRNEWRIAQGIRSQSMTNRADQLALENHLDLTTSLVSKWKSCPTEVLELIQIHHEWPTGHGFPGRITNEKITPLAGLFLVAHEASSLVFETKGKNDFLAALQTVEKEIKDYPNLQRPLSVLIESLQK